MSEEGLYSRLVALSALNAVFEGSLPLDGSLEKFSKKYDLSMQDRAFAFAMCGTVLRYKPALQRLVNAAARRKNDITPVALNSVILLGAAQLFLMHVPDHAAIDTSVRLAEKIGCKKQKGLVNAILRGFQRMEKQTLNPAVPKWLYDLWVNDYGAAAAKEVAKASMTEAPIHITDKSTGKNIPMVQTIPVNEQEGYADGAWWVQDFASHLPVTLIKDPKGKHVLDLCAAPGGKTMQLAAMGATVTAVDISEKRLRRLQENLHRTGLEGNVSVMCADLLKWQPDAQSDIVLLDAPCSATGTLRRHPDLPYIRKMRDIKSLVTLQYDLLNRAKKWVKNGGQLIYCTCSLQKSEGEEQISRFVSQNQDFSRVHITGHPQWQTPDGDIRLLPTYGDMDGFFISILQKRS